MLPAPSAPETPDEELKRPPSESFEPPNSAPTAGLIALLTDRLDSRSTSDCSTESKLLAPVAPCANADVIARANAFELEVRPRVRVLTSSTLVESAFTPSTGSSAIRVSPDENESSHKNGPIRERGKNQRAESSGKRLRSAANDARSIGGAWEPNAPSIAAASSRGVMRQNASGERRSAPSPKPIACGQGNGVRSTRSPLPLKGIRRLRRLRRAARMRCVRSRPRHLRRRAAPRRHR